MQIIKSVNEFETILAENDKVFADFFASWCGPCRMLMPIVEAVAEEQKDKAFFCKINVDEQQELAEKYRIQTIPTLIIFNKGAIAEKQIGLRSKDELVAMVNK